MNQKIGRTLFAAANAIDRIIFTIAGICLVLLVSHVTLDVFFSRVLNQPIKNTIEISSYYYMVALVFLPLATVERHGEHIDVDFLVKALPFGHERVIRSLTLLLGAYVTGLIGYRTGIDAVRSTVSGEIVMGTGFLIIWPARWLLPTGFSLMTLTLIAKAWCQAFGPNLYPDADINSEEAHNDL